MFGVIAGVYAGKIADAPTVRTGIQVVLSCQGMRGLCIYFYPKKVLEFLPVPIRAGVILRHLAFDRVPEIDPCAESRGATCSEKCIVDILPEVSCHGCHVIVAEILTHITEATRDPEKWIFNGSIRRCGQIDNWIGDIEISR